MLKIITLLLALSTATKEQTVFKPTISTLNYAHYSIVNDITTSKNGYFLLSPTEFTDYQAYSFSPSVFKKNSTQSDFTSIDCSERNCAIGSKNGEIYYYYYVKRSQEYYIFTNLGTHNITENLGSNKRNYITRILDKITHTSNVILTAMESSYGVVRYAFGDYKNYGRFAVDEVNKTPIDLLHISNSNLGAVTYNLRSVEIFDITNMEKRINKFNNGGGFMAMLELDTPTMIVLYEDNLYFLKMISYISGVMLGGTFFETARIGITSFRYSKYFCVLDPNGISVMKHIPGASPSLEYYHSFSNPLTTINGGWSLRNQMFRNEQLDLPSWINGNANIKSYYGGSSLKLGFETGFINEYCETSQYSLSAYCITCTTSALKYGDLCLKKVDYQGTQAPEVKKTLTELEAESNNNENTNTGNENNGQELLETPTKLDENGQIAQNQTSSQTNSGGASSSGGSAVIFLVVGVIVVLIVIGVCIYFSKAKAKSSLDHTPSNNTFSQNNKSLRFNQENNSSKIQNRIKNPQDKFNGKLEPPQVDVNPSFSHQIQFNPSPNQIGPGIPFNPFPYAPPQPFNPHQNFNPQPFNPPQNFNPAQNWNNFPVNNGFQPVGYTPQSRF